MIKEMNRTCEKFGQALGVTIKLPNPGRKALKSAMVCNLAVGVGLVTAGVVFTSKWCAALGGISIASSIVLRQESRQRSDD